MKKLCLSVILFVIILGTVCSCNSETDSTSNEITSAEIICKATGIDETVTEQTESLPCTEHSYNMVGVCSVCGERRDCEYINSSDIFPEDMLYRYLISTYGLKYSVTLNTSADGRYKLVKALSLDGKTVCDYHFTGRYSTEDNTIILEPAEEGEAFAEFGEIANISYVSKSSDKSEILNFASTGFLSEGSINARQKITVGEDETMYFELDGCIHETHNSEGICTECGRKVGHNMINNVCTGCGYKRDYNVKHVPTALTQICEHQGTVEKIVYDSEKYSNDQAWTNTVFVYLPYGYADGDSEYNVLYLLHGSGENAAYWLAQLSYEGGYTKYTTRLLDNLHERGLCEPTIVVTPTENLNGTDYFWKELETTLIPLIETRYRTKAHVYGLNPDDVKEGDIINSRECRAFAGLSLGSIITWDIMARELDRFAYFGFYSGGACNSERLARLNKTLKSPKYRIYPIKYAYHSCGSDDSMHDGHVTDYNAALKAGSKMLTDGGNTYFLEKPGHQHNYQAWILDLYNSMTFDFFKY